jgi:hypothetical protein
VVPTTPDEPDTAVVRVRLPVHDPPADLRSFTGCVTVFGVVLVAAAGLVVWASGQATVAYVVAAVLGALALVCFSIKPVVRRQLRRNGALKTARVEFGPDGFRQPLEDRTTLVLPWDDVRRFVFREGQADGRIALAVSLVSADAIQHLNPDCQRESEDGYILSSAMSREEAEKAAAVIERYRPGLGRWTSRNVHRGGFGVPRPVQRLIRRMNSEEPRSVVRAEKASSGRLFVLWVSWLTVIADFTAPAFFDIPPGIPLPVAVAIWVLLYRTRYRGEDGEFALTAGMVTWRPKEGEPVVVRRLDLARLSVEQTAKSAMRRYVAVHAIRRDGRDLPLAAKVSPGAADVVLRDVGVRASAS